VAKIKQSAEFISQKENQKVDKIEPLTMMRRADGRPFTLKVKGQEHLALWSSLQSAVRYKKRNPQLLIFIPASTASPFGQKSLIALRKENLGLFLLVDAGGAHLSDGRKITWEELDTRMPAVASATLTNANGTDTIREQNIVTDAGGGVRFITNRKATVEGKSW
jgi:hypothetical protein